MNKDDIKKKNERSEVCIAYYNNTYNLDDDNYGYFNDSLDRYGSSTIKPVDDIDDIDTEIPMFYGSKKYYKKIIETLETFGGENISGWACDIDSYVYCVSRRENKPILCFRISELLGSYSCFEEKGLIMNIRDFLGIKEDCV